MCYSSVTAFEFGFYRFVIKLHDLIAVILNAGLKRNQCYDPNCRLNLLNWFICLFLLKPFTRTVIPWKCYLWRGNASIGFSENLNGAVSSKVDSEGKRLIISAMFFENIWKISLLFDWTVELNSHCPSQKYLLVSIMLFAFLEFSLTIFFCCQVDLLLGWLRKRRFMMSFGVCGVALVMFLCGTTCLIFFLFSCQDVKSIFFCLKLGFCQFPKP